MVALLRRLCEPLPAHTMQDIATRDGCRGLSAAKATTKLHGCRGLSAAKAPTSAQVRPGARRVGSGASPLSDFLKKFSARRQGGFPRRLFASPPPARAARACPRLLTRGQSTCTPPPTNRPKTANTNTQSAEEVLAQLKTIYRIKRIESEVTMVAAQTKALETLMACMTPIKSTGDSKLDNFYARERNRQRLAAIQTLLHIRTVQREKRLRRAARAKAKAKAARVAKGTTKGTMVGAEGAGHADNGSPAGSSAPSPQRGRRWQPTEGRMTDEGHARPMRHLRSRTPALPPPPPQPTPPMHPHDARVQELRRLRAEKMARRQAEALDAEQKRRRALTVHIRRRPRYPVPPIKSPTPCTSSR